MLIKNTLILIKNQPYYSPYYAIPPIINLHDGGHYKFDDEVRLYGANSFKFL